ncbi:MAG TPA: response regulator [Gemmatimonadaceae bacterium]
MSPESNEALAARLRAMFVEELEDQVTEANRHLLALERTPEDGEELRSLFRVMHTLKGAARAANVPELERLCHRLEGMLASARDEGRPLDKNEVQALFDGVDRLTEAGTKLRGELSPSESSDASTIENAAEAAPRADPSREGVRVGQDRIDTLFTASNRLLILAANVSDVPQKIERLFEEASRATAAWHRLKPSLPATSRDGDQSLLREIAAFEDALNFVRRNSSSLLGSAMRTARDLDRVADDVTRGVRELRMRPFAGAVADLPRVVRDVATETSKQVRLEIEGETVQADRTVLAQIREALLHLVRNAVDHGIEAPPVRRAHGKDPEGVVRIKAALVGDRIMVTVTDDGAGLDIPSIRRRLAGRGVEVPHDDRALARQLFFGGLSTRETATEISGRGVGLDAVRAAADRIRGGVDVSWTPGQGTTFTIEAPLTLATVRVVLARVAGVHVAIPTAFITRLMRLRRDQLVVLDERLAVETDGAPAFVVPIASILGPPLLDRPPEEVVQLVLVSAGDRRVALRVDELLEETEIVVRPIRAHGRVAVPHLSGAAMLATGAVTLVLNVTAATATALGIGGESPVFAQNRDTEAPRRRVLVVDDSITTRTLEASVLEAAGYDVLTAVDGADGWRVLQERGADLVVSDVEMPRMDGLQLTEAMRASSRFRETPVILITALESDEHRSRGLEVGADAYLGKSSFEQEGLLNTVRELIG